MKGVNLKKRASETKDEKTLREMQDPSYWDWEHAQKAPGVKEPRVIISVALSNSEFKLVAAEAERVGKPVSRFIREAAVAAATGRGAGVIVYGGSGYGAAVFLAEPPHITQARGSPVTGLAEHVKGSPPPA